MKFIIVVLLASLQAFAHQSSLTPGGNELAWPTVTVPLAINTNTSDLSSEQARNIILNSIAQWNSASSAKLNSVSSSRNEIKFLSDYPYGSAVLGLTEITFNSSGTIQKATILLNDDYQFKSAPGFYPTGQVYLGDVVTHELGHLFGLSHSEVLDASMFYSSFSGQSSLSQDDIGGVRHKYGSDDGHGSINGYVSGGDNIGILGAHVQAISLKSGKVTGAITNESGYFNVGGLDLDDSYYLYVSPVRNSESLPGYFSNVQNDFCPGKYVGSFFSKCGTEYDGKPQTINLSSSSSSVDVGVITISCSLRSDAAYNAQKVADSFEPVTIHSYEDNHKTEQAFVGWFRNPSLIEWSSSDIFRVNFAPLNSDNYYLKVSIISFPLGTQLEYEVDIENNNSILLSNDGSLQYSPLTQTYKTNFETYVQFEDSGSDLERNNFVIKVRSRKLGSSDLAQTFPDFTNFTSGSYLPYLLMVSLWSTESGALEQVAYSEQELSDNGACLDAPFTYAVKKIEESTDSSATSSAEEQSAAAAGCGTIEPPRNGPGSSLFLMTMGFMFTLMASMLIKTRKKFLS